MNKEYIYESKKVGKYIVEVVQDTDAENPREYCEHSDHMICFHRKYNIGDKHNMDMEELEKIIKRKDVISLPVYLYDHSGLTINTTGFSCRWDSGQIGYIYMEKKDIFEVYGKKKILTKKLKEKACDYMRASIKEYDQYLTGDVYGYRVEDESGSVVGSCWGFYSESEYCLTEGIAEAQSCIKHDIKHHVELVKRWIRNRVPLEKRIGLCV